MEELNFEHEQSKEETALLKTLVTRILSLPRMAVWCAFSAALMTGLLLATTDQNISSVAPLAILVGLIMLGILILLVMTLRLRPKLLENIQLNTGIPIRLRFRPECFWISKACKETLSSDYRCVIAQYWFGNSYILHLRTPAKTWAAGDELLLIPLTQETFDLVYLLADALAAKKKRLIRLKAKQSAAQDSQT